VLRRNKATYTTQNEEIELRWHNGVIIPTNTTKLVIPKHLKNAAVDATFLDLLRATTATGIYVNDNHAYTPTYAPAVFAQHPQNADHYSKADFADALLRLRMTGQVRKGEYKSAGKRHACLVAHE
jgi:hypothetical protein